MSRFIDVLKSKKAWKRLFSASGWKDATTENKLLAALVIVGAIILSVGVILEDDINVVAKIPIVLFSIVGGTGGALLIINAHKPV